eukprot:snap_masked-scaffold_6-processed-gene-16.32-mRNA-1 protein AED:1.00 eAED:1.00 QI:0/0/0/0/1/1/2/0/463
MSENDLPACNFQPYFRMTQGLATFSYILFVTIALWVYNYNHPSLKYRSFPLMLLFTYGVLINIFEQSLNRATFIEYAESNFTEFDLLHQCEFEVFHSNITVPIAILVFGLRLYKWYRNVLYNQALAKYFSTRDKLNIFSNTTSTKTSEADTMSSHLTELQTLKEKGSTKRVVKITILGIILTILYCGTLAVISCPITDACLYEDNSTEALIGLGFNLLPGFSYFVFLYYIRKARKTYPDPFNVLKETQIGFSIPIFLAFIYAVLRFSDAFDVLDENKDFYFSYGIIIDIGILLAFIVLLTIPVFKSFSSSKEKQINQSISLNEVLTNETGRKLFRNHLVFEFSVDNLNFYLAAKNWKEYFQLNPDKKNSMEKSARNLYNRWLKRGSMFEVNLGYLDIEIVKKRIDSGNFSIDMFDDTIDGIYSLMSLDSFTRFQNTEVFKGYIGIGEPEQGAKNSMYGFSPSF